MTGTRKLSIEFTWRCTACAKEWTIAAPGFAGDGVYHYEQPGNRACGPIYAQRPHVSAIMLPRLRFPEPERGEESIDWRDELAAQVAAVETACGMQWHEDAMWPARTAVATLRRLSVVAGREQAIRELPMGALVAWYRDSPVKCARWCAEEGDRSGALLVRVLEAVQAGRE